MGVFAAAVFGTPGRQAVEHADPRPAAVYASAKRRRTCTPPCPRPPRAASSATPTAVALVKNRLSAHRAGRSGRGRRPRRGAAALGRAGRAVRTWCAQRIQDATGGAQSQRVVATDVAPARRGLHRGACRRVPRRGTVDAKRTVRDYPYGRAWRPTCWATPGRSPPSSLTATWRRAVPWSLGDDGGPARHRVPLRPTCSQATTASARVVVDAQGNVVDVVERDAGRPGLRRVPDHQGPRAVRGRPRARRARGAQGRHHRHGQGRGRRRRGHGRSRRRHRGHGRAIPRSIPRSFDGVRSRRTSWELYQTEEAHTPHAQPRRSDGHVPRRVHLQGVQRPRRAQARLRRHASAPGTAPARGTASTRAPPQKMLAAHRATACSTSAEAS